MAYKKAVRPLSLTAFLIIEYIRFSVMVFASESNRRPVASIKSLMKKATDIIPDTRTGNEYKHIDRVMNDLYVKVNTLESTIENNRNIIRNNFVHALLTGQFLTMESMNEYRDLASIQFSNSMFCIVELQLWLGRIKTSLEWERYVLFSIIDHINNMALGNTVFSAAESSDCKVMVIANFATDKSYIQEFVHEIRNYCQQYFQIKAKAAIGPTVDSPLELPESTAKADVLAKYLFWYPDLDIISEESTIAGNITQREQNKELMPRELNERLSAALNLRCEADVAAIADSFAQLTIHGGYSAQSCHAKLLELAYQCLDYGGSMGFSFDNNQLIKDGRLNRLDCISYFKAWILSYAKEVFSYAETKSNNWHTQIIQTICEYIDKNPDKELSLEVMSTLVKLSPKYISRMFKIEMNTSFVDFVNKSRLEKSKDLLLNTQYSAKDISVMMGFGSDGYFNKLFKKEYGVTPQKYRQYNCV